MTIHDHLKAAQMRRALDAERYHHSDPDLCMLCGAYGADKRSLRIGCGYAVHEAVPEAIDLFDIPEMREFGYYLRLCKSCRGALLQHMEQWRRERIELRDQPKDHDGYLWEDYDSDLIPVRMHGRVVMMTALAYAEWKEKQEAHAQPTTPDDADASDSGRDSGADRTGA